MKNNIEKQISAFLLSGIYIKHYSLLDGVWHYKKLYTLLPELETEASAFLIWTGNYFGENSVCTLEELVEHYKILTKKFGKLEGLPFSAIHSISIFNGLETTLQWYERFQFLQKEMDIEISAAVLLALEALTENQENSYVINKFTSLRHNIPDISDLAIATLLPFENQAERFAEQLKYIQKIIEYFDNDYWLWIQATSSQENLILEKVKKLYDALKIYIPELNNLSRIFLAIYDPSEEIPIEQIILDFQEIEKELLQD